MLELDNFSASWDAQYPQISRYLHAHWGNLNTLFNYPQDIRKAIYTRHAIEAASKKWSMPIRDWKTALIRFVIEFEDRLKDYI